jgi:hypothetical protein
MPSGRGITPRPFLCDGGCALGPLSTTLRPVRQEAALQHEPTREILLARANDGDGAAFARFLTAVTPTLRAVIRRRGQPCLRISRKTFCKRCCWRSI